MDIQSNNNGKRMKKTHSEKWNYLNQDTAESILRRLSFSDFYNFGLVCSSWYSLLVNAVKNKHCYPLPQIPLLLLCPSARLRNKVPCFFEVDKERILRFENNIYPRNLLVLGTVDSWLLVSEPTTTTKTTTTRKRRRSMILPNGASNNNVECCMREDTNNTKYDNSVKLFFFNPMSRARVMLPSLMNDNGDDHIPQVTKMVATSAPYDNCPDDEPVYVAGLTCCGIIFCKLTDKCWKLFGSRERKYTDIVMTSNLLYALMGKTIYHLVEVYNLLELEKYNQSDNSIAPKQENLMAIGRIPEIKIEGGCLAHDPFFGDIIMVQNNMKRGFRVFKLERRRMMNHNNNVGAFEWVEVKDLGDRLIFVDSKSCKVISTVGLDEKDVPKRSCIYYALSKYLIAGHIWNVDLGIFCLSDSSFHHFRVAESALKNFANTVWLMP